MTARCRIWCGIIATCVIDLILRIIEIIRTKKGNLIKYEHRNKTLEQKFYFIRGGF